MSEPYTLWQIKRWLAAGETWRLVVLLAESKAAPTARWALNVLRIKG